jgi:transcriptional regulator with XRE-family HTH domain
MPAKQPTLYPNQVKLLASFGERLRRARLRRHLSLDVTCERAGISKMTLFRAEQGNPAVALGTYLRILSVLKLETDLDRLASDDRLGRLLQDTELPERRRRSRKTRPPADTAHDAADRNQNDKGNDRGERS